ncbi:MAG TPA: hypothetical protein PLD27_12205 [bacterium]|nr:hypothetical protein [bacterium]HOL48536.1 hypothetical protein [bacterium]HPQ19988.1 hypothetical protein [bacterium]
MNSYLTFFYYILFEPDFSLKVLKENFIFKFFIINLILLYIFFFNYSLFFEGNKNIGYLFFDAFIKLLNLTFILFIFSNLIHFFAGLFNYEGKIKNLFLLSFFSFSPLILLNPILFLKKYIFFSAYIIIFFWLLWILIKIIKINYSITFTKTIILILISLFIPIIFFMILFTLNLTKIIYNLL